MPPNNCNIIEHEAMLFRSWFFYQYCMNIRSLLSDRNFVRSGFCMHEFYCAFNQIKERKKNILIPVLLEDLNLDDTELDKDHLAVLQQYLRTYTYLDARNYKYNIEKLRKRIIFQLPAVPLSKMLIIRKNYNEDNNDINDDDQGPLLGDGPI